MSLPKQVLAQSEKAEQLLREQAEPVVEQPKQEAAEEQQQPVKVEEVQAAEPVVETPPAPAKPSYEELEQKFRSLQGMFNPMMQKLEGEKRELAAQVNQLTQRLTELEQQAAQTRESGSPQQTFVRPEEVEEYGADFMDVVGRKAKEVAYESVQRAEAAERQATELAKRLAQLEQQFGSVAQQTYASAEERFLSILGKKVPDYQQLNYDEHFLSWLAQRAPGTMTTRQSLLTDAYQAGDVDTVAWYFDTFKEESGRSQRTQQVDTRRAEMAAQAAPRTSGNGQTNSRVEKTWTSAEVRKFYSEGTKGKYSPEEYSRIEADIFKAQQEGRYVA